MTIHTYPGNMHVHSLYSDGSGSVPEIAAAAAASRIRFLIITDHNTLEALPAEGYYNGVAVLVGVELNRKCCHYLALGLKEMVPTTDEEPQQVIDAVREAGGLGFIAHPFEKGSPLIDNGAAYPWTNWPVFGFTGLEIWNYSSHWRGRATTVPQTVYWFLFNRKAAVEGPPQECLQLWDCYTARGHRVVAVGGSDAHAVRRRVVRVPLVFFPYQFLCRTINTYICLREPLSCTFPRARSQIISALAGGRCYVAFDQLYPATGFSFTASRPEGQPEELLMGDAGNFEEGLSLNVRVPCSRAQIRLLRNGRLIAQRQGKSLSCPAFSPGIYRVEVYYKPLLSRPRPWIYANPIYLQSIK